MYLYSRRLTLPSLTKPQNAIRSFLRESNCWYGRASRGKNQALPQSAPIEFVQAFETLRQPGSGPSDANLLLDWSHPMTSVWNSECIHILAAQFRSLGMAGKFQRIILDDFARQSNESLERIIQGKLKLCRTEYLKIVPPRLGANETLIQKQSRINHHDIKTARYNRKNQRRVGVCYQLFCLYSSSAQNFAYYN